MSEPRALRQDPQVEALAALAHEQWSGWMRYLFAQCPELYTGSRLIPVEWATRWVRQMKTPYAELSETEKDSDRTEARRVLAVLAAAGSPPSPPIYLRQLITDVLNNEPCSCYVYGGPCARCKLAYDELKAALVGSPPSPPVEFEKCSALWDERFRRLVKTLRTQAEEANAPTMARRFEQCEDAIVTLLLWGSPSSPETRIKWHCPHCGRQGPIYRCPSCAGSPPSPETENK